MAQTRTQISVGVKSNNNGVGGTVSLFGTDSQLGTRTVAFNADEYGATGLNSEGWYFNFGSVTPTSLTFIPEKMPPGHKLVVAVSYPAGTDFTIKYGVGWMEPNGEYTKVSSSVKLGQNIEKILNELFSNRSTALTTSKPPYSHIILMVLICSSRSTPTSSILIITTKICLVAATQSTALQASKLSSLLQLRALLVMLTLTYQPVSINFEYVYETIKIMSSFSEDFT